MKKLFSILLFGIVGTISLVKADVTFTVKVPSGTTYCYVVGGLPQLSSWAAGAAIPMNRVGEKDQFTVTISGITPSDVSASEGYKYICGPDWKYVEVTASNGEISNRKSIGNPDVVAAWRNTYTPVGVVENWTIAGKNYPIQILLPTHYDKTKRYPITYIFGRHQRYRDAGSDTEMGDRMGHCRNGRGIGEEWRRGRYFCSHLRPTARVYSLAKRGVCWYGPGGCFPQKLCRGL